LNSLSDEDEATANDTSQVNSSSSSSVKSDDFCDVVSDEECLNIVGKPHKIGGNGGNWEKPCQNGGNSDGDVIFISDEDSENPTNEKNEEGGTGGDYFLRKTNFQSNENSVDDEEPDASYADCQVC
jgi:hypothetical protein